MESYYPSLKHFCLESLRESDFNVLESVTLPGSPPFYMHIPFSLHDTLKKHICYDFPEGLYRHQYFALKVAKSEDITISTSTASGKSLVYILAAVNKLASSPEKKVIAFYPAKALIQDQLAKWKSVAKLFGIMVDKIDGSVPVHDRSAIFDNNQIILMTPDVGHAWMMSNLQDIKILAGLKRVCMLVIDEAHVYDGIFGSNMAYFLRRLSAVATDFKLIVTTATIGDPEGFVLKLTGRKTIVINAKLDGSPTYDRHIMRVECEKKDLLSQVALLLSILCNENQGKFIVFADSRKLVEKLSIYVHKKTVPPRADNSTNLDIEERLGELKTSVYPYRAGYEESDRVEIQKALQSGKLKGVISTSALELGLDIGSIDIVICLDFPKSIKSFWQRIGRGGRKQTSCNIFIENRKSKGLYSSLEEITNKEIEPNWLYLENRFLQYAQALCAAKELEDLGMAPELAVSYQSLPENFLRFISNELNPHDVIPQDLYPLKQRCSNGRPHIEFSMRNDIDHIFKIKIKNQTLGEISFSQALREAYPGAIYLHMAKAFRVVSVNLTNKTIEIRRTKFGVTRPVTQIMVFPDLNSGIFEIRQNENGFIAETKLQISQKVTGFTEHRGKNVGSYTYEAGSAFSQNPINRFFPTTGLCFFLDEIPGEYYDPLSSVLSETACNILDLHMKDIGSGRFHAQNLTLISGKIKGGCIFDEASGSLRLTNYILKNFGKVLSASIEKCSSDSRHDLVYCLSAISNHFENCEKKTVNSARAAIPSSDNKNERVLVIAPDSNGILHQGVNTLQVKIKNIVYTPNGIMYQLDNPELKSHMAAFSAIEPIQGMSKMAWFNPVTYEIEEI